MVAPSCPGTSTSPQSVLTGVLISKVVEKYDIWMRSLFLITFEGKLSKKDTYATVTATKQAVAANSKKIDWFILNVSIA